MGRLDIGAGRKQGRWKERWTGVRVSWVSLKVYLYLVAHPTNRKWVTTLVINGISGVSPLITGVITHLLSGMNHQVVQFC